MRALRLQNDVADSFGGPGDRIDGDVSLCFVSCFIVLMSFSSDQQQRAHGRAQRGCRSWRRDPQRVRT